MKIPKIIHQIYDCPTGVPSQLSMMSETWKTEHPDWEYHLWDSEHINKLLLDIYPVIIPTYNSWPFNIQRWESLRYLILYHAGGLYVDLDYYCIQPIDSLLNTHSCCLGLEPDCHAERFGKKKLIGNALMASVPAHPFFRNVIDKISIPDNLEQKNETGMISETTGVKMINSLYEEYNQKQDIELIAAELIAPLSVMEISLLLTGRETQEMEDKVENAYALHYFLGQWRLKN